MVEEKKEDAEIEAKIFEQLSQLYQIIGICLGIPPETFTWEFTNKSKVTQSIGPLTPLEFYKSYVEPVFNMNSHVCLNLFLL